MQLVYDAADGYVLMFGGDGATLYDENWVFQNDSWREIFPAVSPPSTGGGGMVYDAADGYVLLFGGQVAGTSMSNQTWKFVGGNWTELFPSVSPSARQAPAMSYDPADRDVLLFGGDDNQHTFYSDTWAYSSGTWTNRTSTVHGGPSPRATTMTYDAADGYVVLFGGYPQGGGALNDTWTFYRGNWTNVTPVHSPYPRWPVPIAFDAADGCVLIFGSVGTQGVDGYQNDTWEYRAGSWKEVFGPTGPSGRWVSAMTYDPDLRSVVLYGGYLQPNDLGDTWIFAAGNWTEWAPPSPAYPPGRSASAMAYDASDGYVLMFGGQGASGLLNDTWSYAAGTWTALSPTTSPSPRWGAAMTYDSADHYILLFGGNGSSGPLNDTWRFTNGSWQSVIPSSGAAPSARFAAGIADDPPAGYVLLFGGRGTTDLSDSWSFVAGAWNRLSPTGSPAARSGSAMSYDPVVQRVFLFGGIATNSSPPTMTRLSDSWMFGNGRWSAANLSAGPSARDGAGLAYLPTARDLILYGGSAGSAGVANSETWAFDGTNWTPLSPSTDPGPSTYAGLAWESSSGALALFGPSSPGAAPPTTWQFSYGSSNNSSGYPAVPLRVTTNAARSASGTGYVVILTATVSGGRLPYTLQWIYGDGTEGSTLPNSAVPHSYPGPGSYPAVLVVRDGSGQTSRVATPVVVGGTPPIVSPPPVVSGGELAPFAAVAAGVAGGAILIGVAYRRGGGRDRERREGERLVRELRGYEFDPAGPP